MTRCVTAMYMSTVTTPHLPKIDFVENWAWTSSHHSRERHGAQYHTTLSNSWHAVVFGILQELPQRLVVFEDPCVLFPQPAEHIEGFPLGQKSIPLSPTSGWQAMISKWYQPRHAVLAKCFSCSICSLNMAPSAYTSQGKTFTGSSLNAHLVRKPHCIVIVLY